MTVAVWVRLLAPNVARIQLSCGDLMIAVRRCDEKCVVGSKERLGARSRCGMLDAKPIGSGSPLCQDTTAETGVRSFSSPGSDCSEVLAMGIRSAALD